MKKAEKPRPLYVAGVSLAAHQLTDGGGVMLAVYKDIGLVGNRRIWHTRTVAPVDDVLMSEMESAAFTEWERECDHLFGTQARLF